MLESWWWHLSLTLGHATLALTSSFIWVTVSGPCGAHLPLSLGAPVSTPVSHRWGRGGAPSSVLLAHEPQSSEWGGTHTASTFKAPGRASTAWQVLLPSFRDSDPQQLDYSLELGTLDKPHSFLASVFFL